MIIVILHLVSGLLDGKQNAATPKQKQCIFRKHGSTSRYATTVSQTKYVYELLNTHKHEPSFNTNLTGSVACSSIHFSNKILLFFT